MGKTPEQKEANRLNAAKRRREQPERVREIQRRAWENGGRERPPPNERREPPMTDQERSWPERWTIWVCTCGAYSTNRQGGCSHHQGQLPDEPAEFKRKVVAIPADSLKPIIEQLRGMIGVTEHDGTIRPKHLHDLADSLEALTQTGESDAT